MKELLDQLREKDPETWKKIAQGLPIKPQGKYYTRSRNGRITTHSIRDAYIPFGALLPEAAQAWLQAVLQEACREREWFYGQFSMSNPGPYYADISDANNVDHQATGKGDSPAEALLRAYLAAIENQ